MERDQTWAVNMEHAGQLAKRNDGHSDGREPVVERALFTLSVAPAPNYQQAQTHVILHPARCPSQRGG